MRRAALAGVLLFGSTVLWAQQGRAPGNRPGAGAAPPSAQAQAPYDPSGYWVSLITQNWRFRMVAKGPGDYIGAPINAEAKKVADAWTPAAAAAAARTCEAYGGAIIMWLPERLHISWQDANDLRVDTDAGMQTRVLHFMSAAGGARAGAEAAGPAQPPADMQPSRQGYSVARWVLPAGAQRGGRPAAVGAPRYGSLQVTTDHMLPGLLAKNGIPYDGNAKKTEWWDLRKESTGEQWLSISTTVLDPHYLTRPYIYDPVFQKEPDGAKWDPSPCSAL
ncbi:MAG TPA: hypothetical protein VHY19_01390 [Steroidobacteraceae bacterium]|jgi:hypothetical protein|nr:hypothetical protein [Steroidobacteraceae bacterium]